MDFFHWTTKIVSRNKGKSAVAASAYISSTRMENTWDADGNRIPAKQKGRWKTRKVCTTDWDDRGNAERWRAAAADTINEALREAGFTQGFVDPRSYADQGVQRIPMVHEGPDARVMEKRGIHTEVGEKNREIRQQNKLLSQLEARLARLNAWAQYAKKKDELRQYRQAASVLHRCQDDGEKIDCKGWKTALEYLEKEQFMLDYQLEDMKEEVRRPEVVKREFIQENKRTKPERYVR